MLFSPLLLLAQAAALSSAFLVSPQISEDELKDLAFPIDIGAGLALSKISMSRIIRIPCEGCSYKEAGVATDLILDFNLPASDHKTMKLNGATILPLKDMSLAPLKATQMPHAVDTVVYMLDKAQFPVVGVDNARILTSDSSTIEGFKQYSFEMDIIAVDGKPVEVQGIHVVIKEAPDGTLAFGQINPLPKGALKECGMNIMCMFKKMLAKFRNTKLPAWTGRKGCTGRKGNKHGNPVVEGLQGLDTRPPHHGHPHQPHHPHHHHHSSRPDYVRPHRSRVQRIFGQVLLPISVGIVAGIAVSLVGLMIGHGFVMLYRRFKGAARERRCGSNRRRGFFGRRRREHARLAALEADGEAEKRLLGEEERDEQTVLVESPPAYADEVVEIVEKE